HRFEPAEAAVGAPFLGHLHRGAGEVVAVLVQLLLEQLEQGERISGSAGEAGQHVLVLAEAADLARVGLHHRVAEGDLAVAADHDLAVAAHADDGGGVEGFHKSSKVERTRWGRLAGASMRNETAWHVRLLSPLGRGEGPWMALP